MVIQTVAPQSTAQRQYAVKTQGRLRLTNVTCRGTPSSSNMTAVGLSGPDANVVLNTVRTIDSPLGFNCAEGATLDAISCDVKSTLTAIFVQDTSSLASIRDSVVTVRGTAVEVATGAYCELTTTTCCVERTAVRGGRTEPGVALFARDDG